MKEFYESLFNEDCFDGREFYISNELECDEFLENLGIDSNGSEAGIDLFSLLRDKNIHYNQFINIIERLKVYLTDKFMISRIIFICLNEFGINFEDGLKSLLEKFVKEAKTNSNIINDYDLNYEFNNFKELIKNERGKDFVYDSFYNEMI